MLQSKIARGLKPSQPKTVGYARRPRPAPSPRFIPCRASSHPGESSDAGPSTPDTNDLPPELQDLAINEDGFLIDSKTGKVINEMGATRFDVAVRALRGELDPPEWVENSERSSGVLLSALYQFPRSYIFQVVGRPTTASSASSASSTSASSASVASASSAGGPQGDRSTAGEATSVGGGGSCCGKASFVADVAAVISRVTQAEVEESKVEVKERMGGKYLSVAVDVVVRAPELVGMVYDELAKDPRVIMRF